MSSLRPDANGSSPIPVQRLLQLVNLAFRAGRPAAAQSALARIAVRLPQLNDSQMATTLNLADRGGRPGMVADVIRLAVSRPAISPQLAMAILRRADATGSGALGALVEKELITRVDPALRGRFRTMATRLRHGPSVALQVLRETRKARRTPLEAGKLARALIEAGQCNVARRYLRLCHRKWPNAPKIAELLLESFCKSGHPDEAQAWLASLNPRGQEGTIDALWLTLALESGRLDDALALLRREIKDARRGQGDPKLLRVLIALGHLEEAETVADALRTDPVRSLKYSAHFGVLFSGQLLNELRLYRDAQAHGDKPSGSGPDKADALRYFAAAKEALDTWQAAPDVAGAGETELAEPAPIPHRIFQYWDKTDVPPSVEGIMESWRDRPGWEYQLYDRRSATDWLRKRFGRSYARAFTMAKKAAEESDFLRLCLLQAEGGIYADADDRLVGAPEALLALGPGLILFREPFGALENNVICAPKGHPVLTRAVMMARGALLRRDNDMIWTKTGPGFLTRMVAWSLLNQPELAQSVTIVPLIKMGRYVHPHGDLPYKHTPQHWNNHAGPVSSAIETALRDLVASGQGGER